VVHVNIKNQMLVKEWSPPAAATEEASASGPRRRIYGIAVLGKRAKAERNHSAPMLILWARIMPIGLDALNRLILRNFGELLVVLQINREGIFLHIKENLRNRPSQASSYRDGFIRVALKVGTYIIL
jgi:hypothetical protein